MYQININKQTTVRTFLFPDGQPHIQLSPSILDGDTVDVEVSLLTSNDLLYLLEISSALTVRRVKKRNLTIPYLLGARSDRVTQEGSSFDLKIIAELINSCDFQNVFLFDVHSDVATLLIKNSVNLDNRLLVTTYNVPNSVLICPDSGAAKKIDKYISWNTNFSDVVYCVKTRDQNTGNIRLKVLEAEKCTNRNCVIIDDICDGGATFIAIARSIKSAFLTLIVTHGIFSKGFDELAKYFGKIIVTSSRNQTWDHPIVQMCKDYEQD